MTMQDVKTIWQRAWTGIVGSGAPFAHLPGRLSTSRKRERRLRLCETVSLGEKRFLALVEVGHQEFLVGGAGGSVALLKELSSAADTASGPRKVQAV